MCGIFGIHGHPDAAAVSHLGLYSLQHRGQESAGIVATGLDGNAHAVKMMGLVSEGLRGQDLTQMEGDVAIGHTRYSTAGSSTIENAQPMLVRFRDGHIALAHNGNLIFSFTGSRDRVPRLPKQSWPRRSRMSKVRIRSSSRSETR